MTGLFVERHQIDGQDETVIGLVVLVQLAVWNVGAETSNDLSLPGTESQQATDLLTSRFPPQQNGSSPVVFHVAKGKITDAANKQAVESSCKALSKAPHVASAPDPFANAASGLVSKDAKTAFTPVLLDIPNGDVTEELADDILATTAPAQKGGRRRHRRGHLGGVLSKSPTESSEVIGLLGHLLNIPTVGPTLATMIGLGVGIDYALFLVTKHRDQLAGQRAPARRHRRRGRTTHPGTSPPRGLTCSPRMVSTVAPVAPQQQGAQAEAEQQRRAVHVGNSRVAGGAVRIIVASANLRFRPAGRR
jgi:MMPL family